MDEEQRATTSWTAVVCFPKHDESVQLVPDASGVSPRCISADAFVGVRCDEAKYGGNWFPRENTNGDDTCRDVSSEGP